MTSYEDYMRQRVASQVVRTSEGKKALDKVIVKKERQLTRLKLKNKLIDVKNRIKSGVSGYISSHGKTKMSNKQVLQDQKQVTVVENQPVYSNDRSRFFKKSWEVSKRQLYFD